MIFVYIGRMMRIVPALVAVGVVVAWPGQAARACSVIDESFVNFVFPAAGEALPHDASIVIEGGRLDASRLELRVDGVPVAFELGPRTIFSLLQDVLEIVPSVALVPGQHVTLAGRTCGDPAGDRCAFSTEDAVDIDYVTLPSSTADLGRAEIAFDAFASDEVEEASFCGYIRGQFEHTVYTRHLGGEARYLQLWRRVVDDDTWTDVDAQWVLGAYEANELVWWRSFAETLDAPFDTGYCFRVEVSDLANRVVSSDEVCSPCRVREGEAHEPDSHWVFGWPLGGVDYLDDARTGVCPVWIPEGYTAAAEGTGTGSGSDSGGTTDDGESDTSGEPAATTGDALSAGTSGDASSDTGGDDSAGGATGSGAHGPSSSSGGCNLGHTAPAIAWLLPCFACVVRRRRR